MTVYVLVGLVAAGVLDVMVAGVAGSIVKDAAEDVAALDAAGIDDGRRRVARHEWRRGVNRLVLAAFGLAWASVAWVVLKDAPAPLREEVVVLVGLFVAMQVVLALDTVAASIVRRRLHLSALQATAARRAGGSRRDDHLTTGELRVQPRPDDPRSWT